METQGHGLKEEVISILEDTSKGNLLERIEIGEQLVRSKYDIVRCDIIDRSGIGGVLVIIHYHYVDDGKIKTIGYRHER